jgi:hypothetical protein
MLSSYSTKSKRALSTLKTSLQELKWEMLYKKPEKKTLSSSWTVKPQ